MAAWFLITGATLFDRFKLPNGQKLYFLLGNWKVAREKEYARWIVIVHRQPISVKATLGIQFPNHL